MTRFFPVLGAVAVVLALATACASGPAAPPPTISASQLRSYLTAVEAVRLPDAPQRRGRSAGEPFSELGKIAIIEDAGPKDIPLWMDPTLNAVYQVVGDDDLSRPIPA